MSGLGGDGRPLPTTDGLAARLGVRARRRAEPRLGVALAGVGILMIVVGIVIWAGERTAGDDSVAGESGGSLGVLLSLAVVTVGYVVLVGYRRGPAATTGVAASTLGVPVLLGFMTFDATRTVDAETEAYFSLPFDVDSIVVLSVAVWLVSYLWVPVARGRAFYLAASTFLGWLYLLEKVEDGALGYMLTLPYSLTFLPLLGVQDEAELPDATRIGWASLGVGVMYYAAGAVLDLRGHNGVATPYVAAGFVATVMGLAHLARDLDLTGTGVLLLVIGPVLAICGVTQRRRFTTWAWAAGIGLGLVLVVADIFEDSAAGFGITAIVLGVGLVVGAHLVAVHMTEPDEMHAVPSRFARRQPAFAAPAMVAGAAPVPGASSMPAPELPALPPVPPMGWVPRAGAVPAPGTSPVPAPGPPAPGPPAVPPVPPTGWTSPAADRPPALPGPADPTAS